MKTPPWRYALGTLGLILPSQTFGTFFAYYYVDVLGLAVGAFALARTVYSLWDAVNDPMFGYLSDRTRTPWGRRRPWLIGGLPFLLLAFVLTFAVPEVFRGPALFWYCLLALLFFETFSALLWVNYMALFPELFRTLAERARANAFRQGFQMVGLIVSLAFSPLLFDRIGFALTALLYAGLGGILALVSFLGCREDPEAQKTPAVGFLEAFRYTLTNRAFWIFALANALLQFVLGTLGAGIPFYVRYSLGLGPEAASLLFGATFLLAVPLVTLWARWAVAWGSKRAWMAAIGVLALASLLLYLPHTLPQALLAGAGVALGLSGVLVLGDVVIADIIDRDAEATGTRREGVYFSVNGFIGRLSGPLQGLTFALLALLFGYVSGEHPGPRPDEAFRFFLSVPPFLAGALAFFLARSFPEAHP